MSYISKYTKYTIKDLRYKSGVYIITNTINKKYYIGGAIDFYDRFRLHIADLLKNKHFNTHLQRSVNTYGLKKFKFEILQQYPIDKTFEMETMWIEFYDATNKNNGYNTNKYANTRLGAVLSQETKDKISNTQKGRKLPQEQIDLAWENCSRKISIVVLDINGNYIKEYPSINRAGIAMNILTTNIVQVLKGKAKTAKNHIFIYKSEYDPNKNYSRIRGVVNKKVGQYTISGELINVYKDCKQAADSVNGNQANVHAVCTMYRRNRSYKGYDWKFIE